MGARHLCLDSCLKTYVHVHENGNIKHYSRGMGGFITSRVHTYVVPGERDSSDIGNSAFITISNRRIFRINVHTKV